MITENSTPFMNCLTKFLLFHLMVFFTHQMLTFKILLGSPKNNTNHIKSVFFLNCPVQPNFSYKQPNLLSEPYEFCYPYIKYRTYSTNRDLCITPVFFKENNMQPNLFSVRKSGCQATIIFMTEINHKFNENLIILMKIFKVKIIEGNIENMNIKRHTDFIRDSLLYEFLKIHVNEYDRIFFYDSFDVFFEKDPFKYFREEKMYFFEEGPTLINGQYHNRGWVTDCYGNEGINLIGKFRIICSGTIASGSSKMFLKFLALFTSLPSYSNKSCNVDQSQLAYGVYAGLFKQGGIDYIVVPYNNSPVASIAVGPTSHVPYNLERVINEYNLDLEHFQKSKFYENTFRNDNQQLTDFYFRKVDTNKDLPNVIKLVEHHKMKLLSMLDIPNHTSFNEICKKNEKYFMMTVNGYQSDVIHQYNRRQQILNNQTEKCKYHLYIKFHKKKADYYEISKEIITVK